MLGGMRTKYMMPSRRNVSRAGLRLLKFHHFSQYRSKSGNQNPNLFLKLLVLALLKKSVADTPVEIDEYELLDPVDILTPLEKSGIWDGVKPTKWSERKEAVAELSKLASTRKITPGDFAEVCRTLKKEKLKEREPALTESLTQTLQAMHKCGCLNLADIVEDVKFLILISNFASCLYRMLKLQLKTKFHLCVR